MVRIFTMMWVLVWLLAGCAVSVEQFLQDSVPSKDTRDALPDANQDSVHSEDTRNPLSDANQDNAHAEDARNASSVAEQDNTSARGDIGMPNSAEIDEQEERTLIADTPSKKTAPDAPAQRTNYSIQAIFTPLVQNSVRSVYAFQHEFNQLFGEANNLLSMRNIIIISVILAIAILTAIVFSVVLI